MHTPTKESPSAFMRAVPDGTQDGIDLTNGAELPNKLSLMFGRWLDQPQFDGDGAPMDLTGLDDDEDLGALRQLHELSLNRYRDITRVLAQVRDDPDPSLNRDTRLKLAAKVILPKLDEIKATAERELARTEASIEYEMDTIAAEVRRAASDELAVHPDVRAHFKGLSEGERGRQLDAAIASGDRLTLQALTAGPAYLGGLTAAQHERARYALARLVSPDRVRRVEALRAGQKVASGAVHRLQKQAAKFIDFNRARELLAHDARRQAQLSEG